MNMNSTSTIPTHRPTHVVSTQNMHIYIYIYIQFRLLIAIYVPFILPGMFDHVEAENMRKNLYSLFGLLSEITNLILTRAIHVKAVDYVHDLLGTYNKLFVQTFGDMATINQHMMMHARGQIVL